MNGTAIHNSRFLMFNPRNTARWLAVLAACANLSQAAKVIPPPPAEPAVPAPVSRFTAADVPNDGGGAVRLSWAPSPFDSAALRFAAPDGPARAVKAYRLFRSMGRSGEYSQLIEVGPGTTEFPDEGLANGTAYHYRIQAVGAAGGLSPVLEASAVPRASWFNGERTNMVAALVLVAGILLLFIVRARSGVAMSIRKIAGLAAVDEAIGRATEMGRPILYLPSGGLSAVSDIQTLASLVILGRVAAKTAEYETKLLVPCSDPLVMALAREIVKASCMEAARPDAFRPENIRYLTNEQFAFTAGVDGMMLRERPAANFFIGTFYAEALILAETGYATGAIQIAGTAMITQLPFFVAACDYTLIGEEIYAASAYLSKEPVLLGSIKGQDWAKAAAIAVIVAGIALETLALRFPQLHAFAAQWLLPK